MSRAAAVAFVTGDESEQRDDEDVPADGAALTPIYPLSLLISMLKRHEGHRELINVQLQATVLLRLSSETIKII